MNKKKISNILSGIMGFKKRGDFYIGNCNDSVISGYSLDVPPSAIYICRFALPAYDNVEFLHMALGKRIVALPKNGKASEKNLDLSDFLRRDWSLFSKVDSCESLIEYINAERLESTYALWVRYLTCIRRKEFEAAERLDAENDVTSKFLELRVISKHFANLSEARKQGGWEACSALIDDWSRKTTMALC